MKTFFVVALAIVSVFLGGCHKDDTQPKGALISDEDAAVSVLIKIDNLWNAVLKPQLTVTSQYFSDTVLLDGPEGKITVNGSYEHKSSSSSWSSSSSSITDVTVTFIDYQDNDVFLNGKLRFYDASSSRTACSGSACASSNDRSVTYFSKDANENTLEPLTIAFKDLNGKSYRDKITMDVNKKYVHWQGILVNSKQDTIGVTY